MPVYGEQQEPIVQSDLYTDKPYSNSGQTSPVLPTTSSPFQRPSRRPNRLATWWKNQSRTRKMLVLALVGLALLALILGLALGLSLGKSHGDQDPSTDYVPSTASGDRSTLLTPGYWYTAPENGTNFNWTAADPQWGSYRADSQGVDIVIDSTQRFQQIDGFGAALTDSSAYLLSQMKAKQSALYARVMDFVFNNATGVGITRVSLGASDFSVGNEYSYISTPPNFATAGQELNASGALLSSFSLERTQSSSDTIPVLLDALQRNPALKVILTPWSPPGFMKSNNTMNGGTLRDGFIPLVAQYYAQSAAAWAKAGVKPWAMTLQNEPSQSASYPSMGLSAVQQAQLAVALKSELAVRGLESVQVWAHDDNYASWQSADEIVNTNASAVDAVAFHCYRGDPSQIAQFQAGLRSGAPTPIHMTECTGTGKPANRWAGMQAWLTRVYWPLSQQNARSILQWNLALDSGYGPHLKSSYCTQCTGSLTVSSPANPSDPYVDYNDQLFLTAHFSAASTDLTNLGGGPSLRIAAQQGSQYSLATSDWQCLNWTAYAAPIQSSTLTSPQTGTTAQATRRVALVIANTCQDSKNLVVSSDGRRSTLAVQQGLSTFVWTAP